VPPPGLDLLHWQVKDAPPDRSGLVRWHRQLGAGLGGAWRGRLGRV